MKATLTVQQWRRLVFASDAPEMTGSVKVLCLYLADHMRETDRKVSVPRKTIATALGCHEQRVAERFRKAVDAGFLSRSQAGHTGRTAEYQAIRPGLSPADCVPQTRTQLGARRAVHSRNVVEPDSARLCTAPLDANKPTDLSAGPTGRDGGSNEETEGHGAFARLAACEAHGSGDCDDARCSTTGERRRSA